MSEKENDNLGYALKEVERKVDKILNYFWNDDKTGQKGLVQRVADNEEAIAELKNKRDIDVAVKKGQIAVYSTIGAGIGLTLTWLIKILIPVFLKLI